MSVTTLDLHGYRLEQAISQVTLFLDRIRRTVAASPRNNRMGGTQKLIVQIITGSGSHSTHGPVLRGAVQRLLEKRGMNYRLEQGGGAFSVDALSGWDLYDSGPAVDTKVVTTEQEEFNQLAFAARRRNKHGANFASAAVAQCTARGPPVRTVSVPNNEPFQRSISTNSDPLPAQIAHEENAVRAAVQQSITESQRHHNNRKRFEREAERQYQQAISQSEAERRKSDEISENEESLMKVAYEQSLRDEEYRQRMTDQQYEDALILAMEQSTQQAELESNVESEDDLLARALAESKAMEQSRAALKSNAESEDDLLRRVLAESKAMADEAEHANSNEEDLLEKVLAESKLEEERRWASQEDVLEGKKGESLGGVDILQQVMLLSLKQEEEEQQEEMEEEETIKKALELSKQFR